MPITGKTLSFQNMTSITPDGRNYRHISLCFCKFSSSICIIQQVTGSNSSVFLVQKEITTGLKEEKKKKLTQTILFIDDEVSVLWFESPSSYYFRFRNVL